MVECIINIYKPASVQEDKQYEEEAEISSVKPAVSLSRHHCVWAALSSLTTHQQTGIFSLSESLSPLFSPAHWSLGLKILKLNYANIIYWLEIYSAEIFIIPQVEFRGRKHPIKFCYKIQSFSGFSC